MVICPYGILDRGLTTCPLYVSHFVNSIPNDLVCKFDRIENNFLYQIDTHIGSNNISYHLSISVFYHYLSNNV